MDHLSKQQLILLALLVSFVTSLATGIFTVSLMDQAPGEVVRVINNVVEKTVEKASPQKAAAVEIVSREDQVEKAVDRISKSIVKIVDRNDKTVTGLGLVVSKNGVILIDKSVITSWDDYDALLSDGTPIPVSLIQSEVNGDLAFMAPALRLSPTPPFIPITYAGDLKLGQSIYSLAGTTSLSLGHGMISKIGAVNDPGNDTIVATTIENTEKNIISIAFDITGSVIGIETFNLARNPTANFLEISKIRTIIPSL